MDSTKTCAHCGKLLPLNSLGWCQCGQAIHVDVRDDVINPAQKSPNRAFWLSFGLIAGLGQFYVGQIWKGWLWMLISIVAGIPTVGLGMLAANLASGIDASKVARKLSRGQPSRTWEWFPS